MCDLISCGNPSGNQAAVSYRARYGCLWDIVVRTDGSDKLGAWSIVDSGLVSLYVLGYFRMDV
jgi:hypothetical protein